jgi:hypothetical protein
MYPTIEESDNLMRIEEVSPSHHLLEASKVDEIFVAWLLIQPQCDDVVDGENECDCEERSLYQTCF